MLASCHSLTFVDDMLVGDPMEKAVVKAMDWSVGKGKVYYLFLFINHLNLLRSNILYFLILMFKTRFWHLVKIHCYNGLTLIALCSN